ncbi:MAG: hypothetical protein U0228_30810 [Myxococcaceae bacterium]
MKNVRPLIFGFALGVLAAFGPSCGGKTCGPSNCATGCCDAMGSCQLGNSASACGQLGGTCSVCQFGTACNLGVCMQTSTGGGTGGGTSGGGTGGGTTGGGTTGGGTTGGGTTGGGGGTCDGCLFNGSCIARANSNNDTLCGQGGVTCAMCSGGQHCNNFICSAGAGGGGGTTGGGGGTTGGGGATGGGTGGGTTGGGGGSSVTVGMTCTNSTQCAALGAGATCKLQTTPFTGHTATSYPSGFCTLPCTGKGTCPGGAACAGGASSWPYLFNEVDRFCVKSCTGANQCGTGFMCLYVDDLTQPVANRSAGCWMDDTNAVFTGGGLPSKAGQACTTNSQCGNPPDPILGQCVTTLTNGYCLIDSSLDPSGAWCQSGGRALGNFPLSDGGVNHFCVGTCTTVGQLAPNGRTGYTCFNNSNGTGNVMWKACSTNTDCFTSAPFCNATTGFCCADQAFTNCANSF